MPLNIHIRGVSDVDLLEIHGRYFTYSTVGVAAGTYGGVGTGISVVQEVLNMRSISEEELRTHFWGATVDTTNAKSIQLSDEIFRGVTVVDKFTRETTDNFPFLFAHYINQKALATNDGAKMAIRLLKNIKSDSDDEIGLSSYDIASLMFHCPDNQIMRHVARDLSILSGAENWLSSLCGARQFAEDLMTPDRTRRILDKAEKWDGLGILSKNLTELSLEVDREIAGPYVFGHRDLGDVRKNLNESRIPLVPNM